MNHLKVSYTFGENKNCISYTFFVLSSLSQKTIDLAVDQWKQKSFTGHPQEFIEYIENIGFPIKKL
jgi:hypothetical protein